MSQSSASSLPAGAQAELMEREKTVMEHQQRLESLRETVRAMANRQVVLQRSRRRAQLTVAELGKLPPQHTAYRGIGRAFFRAPVNVLMDDNNAEMERSEAELKRLSNEKQRTAELAVREEEELRRALEEYAAAVKVIQAATSKQQQQQAQAQKA